MILPDLFDFAFYPIAFAIAGLVLHRIYWADRLGILVGLTWVGGVMLLALLSRAVFLLEEILEQIERVMAIYGQVG